MKSGCALIDKKLVRKLRHELWERYEMLGLRLEGEDDEDCPRDCVGIDRVDVRLAAAGLIAIVEEIRLEVM